MWKDPNIVGGSSIREGRNGQATECIVEGSSSGHPGRSRRKGDAGRGFVPNGLPRSDEVAVVLYIQEDRGGVAA